MEQGTGKPLRRVLLDGIVCMNLQYSKYRNLVQDTHCQSKHCVDIYIVVSKGHRISVVKCRYESAVCDGNEGRWASYSR